MPTIDSEKCPMFLETFDYTGKRMVSYKIEIAEWNKEMRRVRKAVGGGWNMYSSTNPYLERYGIATEKGPASNAYIQETSTNPEELYRVMQHEWYQKVRHEMKTVSIKDFVIHLIVKSKEAFKNTAKKRHIYDMARSS